MVQRLEVLRERLTSTEKFIDAELDHRRVLLAESAPAVPVQASTGEPCHSMLPPPLGVNWLSVCCGCLCMRLRKALSPWPCRRNELVSLDIFVTAVMAMFGFVSMVAGIGGEF